MYTMFVGTELQQMVFANFIFERFGGRVILCPKNQNRIVELFGNTSQFLIYLEK